MHLCCSAILDSRLRCGAGAQNLRHKKIKVMAVNPGAVRGLHVPHTCSCPTYQSLVSGSHRSIKELP